MKILITGAHFTPAQAVIEELQKTPRVEIVYLGRKYTREGDKSLSVESQVLPKLGVKFIPVISGRLQRLFTIYTIPSLFKIPIGILQSFYLILREKPEVVLSFGGYVSVPVVFTAWLLSIPIITHEQTLVSGLANTINSWFADKVAVSFERSVFKGKKVILTGLPIRRDIIGISRGVSLVHPRGGQIILVMGGNQGSHIINLALEGCLKELLKIAMVYHQTGDSKYRDYERLEELGKSGERYKVKKWIGEEYAVTLQEADLVVSRAGINTLTELAYLSKPALVIPIPYLYKNEQMVNAKFFKQLGLVRILPQEDLTPQKLLANIKNILNDLNHFKKRAEEARKVVIPDAAKRLALETILLARREHEV